MPDLDFVNETPEEAAALESIRTETPIVEAPPTPVVPAAVAEEPPKVPEKKPEERVRLVPHAALHEERENRKALQRQLDELRAAKPKPEAPAELDEHTDPIGVIGQLKAKLAGYERNQQEAQQQSEAMADLGRRVGARVQAYAADHPEYSEQVKFLRQSRYQELKHLRYDDDSIARQMMQEEVALGQRALETDSDPGEMVAAMAVLRGFKAKESDPDPKLDPEPRPAPQAAAIKEEISKTEAKIARLERGQKAARSPSNGGGGAPSNELSLEEIANLDGAAFDKAFEKHAKTLMA